MKNTKKDVAPENTVSNVISQPTKNSTQAEVRLFENKIKLISQDLITYETRLKEALSRFISFKAYSLYFPTGETSRLPKWLPEEKKLLLPLISNDEVLGVFVASGAKVNNAQMALLGEVCALALENLLLYKQSLIDPASKLYNRQYLISSIAAAVESVAESFTFGLKAEGSLDLPQYAAQSSFSVLIVNFSPLVKLSREYGLAFAEKFYAALAAALKNSVPEQALAAVAGDVSFAVFLPQSHYVDCLRLGREIYKNLSQVELRDPLTGVRISLPVSVGFVCFPHDAETGFPKPNSLEQAHLLLRRARMAATRAWDIAKESDETQKDVEALSPNLLGFNEILLKGGKITKGLPAYRAEVNLGLAMGAREGQHFKVYTPDNAGGQLNKGEIALLDVHESSALAEVIHQEDPAVPLEEEDRLELLPDYSLPNVYISELDNTGNENQGSNIREKMMRHRDFLARMATDREKYSNFCLALVRISPHQTENTNQPMSQTIDQAVEKTLNSCAIILNKNSFAARYGQHSIIYFIPQENPSELAASFKTICTDMEQELGLDMAVGLAMHPFLNYRKTDSLDNLSKALDYALLLEKPRVGIIDSLALNIRADRYFSQGDMFSAINEYKQALLADEHNITAWTSLGVCFAAIDNHSESRRCFEKALALDDKDVPAIYNLAQVFQAEGEADEAANYFERCLKLNPDHVYASLRLGQLAEQAGNYEKAKSYYEQAGAQPWGEGPAARHLARLALVCNEKDEARERLHQALSQNPQDALALGMLADIYLADGDDPEIALTLARQSISLRPDYRMGWLSLARAFEECGDTEAARKARLKAADL